MTDRRLILGTASLFAMRIGSIAINLALMPVLFRCIDAQTLGLWFLMGQGTSLLSLFDFGLQVTLARRVALAPRSDPSRLAELSRDLAVVRYALRLLAAAVLILGVAAGWCLLPTLRLDADHERTISVAWSVICLGYAASLATAHWSSILHGCGLIGADAAINLGCLGGSAVGQAVVAHLGGGLVALATVSAATTAAGRIVAGLLAARANTAMPPERARWDGATMSLLLRPSLAAWMTSLGSFLILRTDQFFIAAYLRPADIPPYQVGYQIVANLYAFAGSFAAASSAFVSHAWSRNDVDDARAIIRRNLSLAVPIMCCASAALMLCGDSLVRLWLGDGHFVGYPILLVFCATLTLEAHHKTFEYAVRATGQEIFSRWYIASGVLNLTLTWLLVHHFGALGVAVGTLLAQLGTLNWYATLRGLRTFSIGISEHALKTLLPSAIAGGLVYAAGTAVIAGLGGRSLSDLACVAIAATLGLGALYALMRTTRGYRGAQITAGAA